MTFYVGVDLHKTQFTVHVRTEEMIETQDQIKIYPTTESGYAEFLKRIRIYRQTGAVVKLAVESTGNTKFFKNQAEKAGAEVTVVNTVKFRVINESVTKTDKHDAATLSEFLKDYKLPECYLCSKETENMRRLIKSRERLVRAQVGQKNEIHALLVSLGMQDDLRSLQSKKGRQKVLDALESNNDYVLEAQSVKLMLEIIDTFQEKVKIIEKQLEELTKDDEMVKRLLTIRGCGKITAWIIRAYTEDISRFSNSKKYSAFCGLVPRVKDSNETVHHGSITRHGPVELRTAYVQLFMGMRRCKDTANWRMMQRYEYMKKNKGSGKSIVSGARKIAEIVWALLSSKTDFDSEKMRGTYTPIHFPEQNLPA